MLSFILLFFEGIRAATDVTPYGTNLGANKGTIGYSNGNSDYISEEYNQDGDIYYGMKWQCVEYSRRWLIQQYRYTFESVDGAADIWSLKNFVDVDTSHAVNITKVENGSKCKPEVGNVLIYKRGGSDIPYGHVAIIVDVSDYGIKVAEENWDNDYWPGNYSREMNFTIKNDKYYLIDEEYPMYGWIEYPNTYSSCSEESSSSFSWLVLASTFGLII